MSAATWREATSVQFPGLAGVLPGFGPFDPCDWGLGVEIRGRKHPHWTGTTNSPSTFGHFGQTGSFLWVDPVAGVLCAGLADRRFGVWASRAWPALADAVLAEVGHRRRRSGVRPDGTDLGRQIPVRLRRMKGVLLAGGTGSRLHPLTRITNKHLLPIYDRPMINWGIEALVNAGITEIMLVTGGTHAGEFLRLLGNGQEFGIDRLSYGYQERPGGIAEALGLAARFVDGDPVLVMLADNIFEQLDPADGGRLPGRAPRGPDPADPGGGGRAPPPPRSAHLRRPATGHRHHREARAPRVQVRGDRYLLLRRRCVRRDPDLVPSGRGELEITDVNNHYIAQGAMAYDVLEGFWGDAGESIDAYYTVNDFVRKHGANKG